MRLYKPQGIQAINPQALFWMFPEVEEDEETEEEEYSTITIRGPIIQHGYWWESYESIKEKFKKASEQNKETILVKIDSPGGEVAGCFDTARYIKKICKDANKKIIVHVEGQCCSAAYALASVADRIYVSKTADVGSIGVLALRYDETKADDLSGYRVNLITSGARKSDWNPHVPFSKEEEKIHQEEINELAQEFFTLVALNRNLSEEKIKSFEAGSFRGSMATKLGLVDKIGSLDHVIASLKSKDENQMDEKEKEAMDALRAIIEDEECTEEEKEKARKALAILEENEEEEAEDGEDDPEAEDEDGEPEAEDEEDEEEGKKALKGVSPKTAAAITAHSAKMEKRLASVEKRYSMEKKKKLINAHGGVSKGLVKILITKPLKEVKAILNELPKPKKANLGTAAKTATVQSIRGGKDGGTSQLPPDQSKLMRRAMGMEKEETGVVSDGNVLKLGAIKE